MSHHLDTPLARQNGRLYIDDLYVFPGQDSTVLVMDVNSTITGPDIQPGFHPEGRYEFKVHLDDADYEALTYRVSFAEAASDGRQGLRLHALTGDEAREDGAEGTLVLDGRTGEAASRGDTRIRAGRIADSFYVDLSLLSIVNGAVQSGTAPDLSAWRPAAAQNSFAGPTVESIVLEANTRHPSADFSQDGKHVADLIAAAMPSLVLDTAVPSGLTPAVTRDQRAASFPYVVPA